MIVDILADSQAYDENLDAVIKSLLDSGSREDNIIECKASALSWQPMMDGLVKTLVAFLNSKKGGFVLIGICEDENKDLIFEGLENTEKKKDDQGLLTGKKSFLNTDDYEQNLTAYISNNVHEGANRVDENIQIKFRSIDGKTFCALIVKPHFLGPNQIPVFGKIYESHKNRKMNQFEEIFFLRQGNKSIAINGVELANLTATRRIGGLVNPTDIERDNPNRNPSTFSDYSTLIAVNNNAIAKKGQPMLEITVEKNGMERKLKRYHSMGNSEQIARKAEGLLGKKIITTTWGNDKTPPEVYEKLNFFNNIYPAIEKKTF